MDDLTTLTREQLLERHARITALLAGHKSPAVEGEEALIHDVLCEQLKALSLPVPPLPIARRQPQWRPFTQHAATLAAYVRDNLRPTSRLERRKAYTVLVRMFLRWLQETPIPVGHKTACYNLGKIPALVLERFPGYLEAGLLRMLIDTTSARTA